MSKKVAEELQKLESELQKSEKTLVELKDKLQEQIESHDQYDSLEGQRGKLEKLKKELADLQAPSTEEKEKLEKNIKITNSIVIGTEKAINESLDEMHKEIASQGKVVARLKAEIKTLKINTPALADLQKEVKPLKMDPLAKANLENALAGRAGAPVKMGQQEMQADLAGFKVSDQAKATLMARFGGTIQPKTKIEQVNNPNIGNKPTEVKTVKNSPEDASPSLKLDEQQKELGRPQANLNPQAKTQQELQNKPEKTQQKLSQEEIQENIRRENELENKVNQAAFKGDLELAKENLQEKPLEPTVNLNSQARVNDLNDFDILEDEERLNALEDKIRELEEPYKRYELLDNLKENLANLKVEEEEITRRIEQIDQIEVDNMDLTLEESEELDRLTQDLRDIEREREQISVLQDEILDKLGQEEQLNNTLHEEIEKQVIGLKRMGELNAISLLDITIEHKEELEIGENKIKDFELEQRKLSKEILILGNEIMEPQPVLQKKSMEELEADLEVLTQSFEKGNTPETDQDLGTLEERLKKFELAMKQSDMEDKLGELDNQRALLSDNYESLTSTQEDIIERMAELESQHELSDLELAELNALEAELDECQEKLAKATLDLQEIDRELDVAELELQEVLNPQEIEGSLDIDKGLELDKGDLGLDLPEELKSNREVGDGINFGVSEKSQKSQKSQDKPELSAGAHSIAEDIKEQVIDKQIQAVKDWADTQSIVDEKGNKISELSNAQFSRYLRENSDIAGKALSDPTLKSNLEKVEVSGYKKVHDMHKDEMATVEWKQDVNTKEVRVNPIIKDGVTLCNLEERTSKESLTITTSAGEQVEITSHRIINFQTHLNDGAEGPLDISMAVKGKDGRNIAESKAVYFTAHYDDSGKLMEVSTPKPIKFLGTGDQAIGYIEHGGEVYTLPVTKGNYEAMMKEVHKNNGIGFELSETVEKPKAQAKDTILGLPAKSHEQLQAITKNLDQSKVASTAEKTVVTPVTKTQVVDNKGRG